MVDVPDVESMSLRQRFCLLSPAEREAFLDAQDPAVIAEMAREEWWWTARPKQIPPDGPQMVNLVLAGRGFGKGLILSTAIPGPHGFRKLGELHIGDQVLGEDGTPCRITGIFDYTPEVAYRLTFSDGTTVDACDEHQWVTWEHRDRKAFLRSAYVHDKTRFPVDWPHWRALSHAKGGPPRAVPNAPGPRIRTTQDIVNTLTHGRRPDTNHSIPVAVAVLPDAVLPIDPWLLGYWLGNGASASGALYCHVDDLDYVTECVSPLGFSGSSRVMVNKVGNSVGYVGTVGLTTILREQGLLGNKHVPERYLWASVTQRKSLLAGLLDSDGHGQASAVEFSSTQRQLAEAVLHLARSLGQVASLSEGRAALYGIDKGPKYRVCWRPTFNPFSCPRKRATYVAPATQALRTQHRMITSAYPIEPEPMRCLTVDSPNSMFLITEAFIPTHNTKAGAEWTVEHTLKHRFDSHGTPTEFLVVSERLSDVRLQQFEGGAGILAALNRRGLEYRYLRSPRPMVIFPDNSRIYGEPGDNADVGRGYNASGAWCDEIAKWSYAYESWYEGIMPCLRADLVGDHPRAFVTTTPKPTSRLLRDWLSRTDGSVHVIRGSTFENQDNLSQQVITELRTRYEGTTIGRQELYGEMLDKLDGALFSPMDIEECRIGFVPEDLIITVVGVDPSLTDEGDEMGVVVVGIGVSLKMYVLADASVRAVGREAAIHVWRTAAMWGAELVVYEENLGKRWMEQVFRDAYFELVGSGELEPGTTPPMKGVDAKLGKRTRGEPVAMRQQQKTIFWVGNFKELEGQCCEFSSWDTRESPDRLDAFVHACRHLMTFKPRRQAVISSPWKYAVELPLDLR